MRTHFLLTALVLLPLSAAGAAEKRPEGRYYPIGVFLAGGTQERAPVEALHVMRAPARDVILHIVFEKGLYRLSRTGATRGTTAGVYIEVNDAELPTHPVRNPFCPIPVDRGRNPDWKEFVERDFPFPNPEPGYWYTWAKVRETLERPIHLHFSEPGRFRIRVRGVTDLRRKDIRVATLAGITEVGAAPEPEIKLAPPAAGARRVELAVPTGRRATSVFLVQREAPPTVKAGETFPYTIRVINLTGDAIENVQVVESGEEELRIEGSTPPFKRIAGPALAWELGTLRARETRTIKVRAAAVRAGSLVRALTLRWDSKPLLQIVDVEK